MTILPPPCAWLCARASPLLANVPPGPNPLLMKYLNGRNSSEWWQYDFDWQCGQCDSVSIIDWSGGHLSLNTSAYRARTLPLFVSFEKRPVKPDCRIHASPQVWLAGSEQPRRLQDKKCPHFWWIFVKVKILQSSYIVLNWFWSLGSSTGSKSHKICVFAGSEPPWNLACRLRGGFYNWGLIIQCWELGEYTTLVEN